MKNNSALILIDIQQGFHNTSYWGERNNPHAEKNMRRILGTFRSAGLPVFHVQHLSTTLESPLRPDQPGVKLMDIVFPTKEERVFQKNVNSAFIGTELENTLKTQNINTLFFIGISTDHCVSTSVRMASNLGFRTFVIADATIAFERVGFDGKRYSAEEVHAVTLASLHNEFATVITTSRLLSSDFSFLAAPGSTITVSN